MKGEMTSILCNVHGHHPHLYEGSCICQNCRVTLCILVNDGGVFFGTVHEWQDCFFDHVCLGHIDEYCEDRGWKLEYREEARPS